MTVDVSQSGIAHWLSGFVSIETEPEMVSAWVDRTTRAILAEVPEISRIEGLASEIHETVHDHWVAFLAEFGQSEIKFQMPQRGEQLAIDVARAQLPLETLIRFYRVAQQAVWVYITGVVNAIRDDDLDNADVLIYFWDRAGVWLDESITVSIDIYQSERGRVLAGAAARRYETVRAVLDGELDDTRQISSALGGYPMSVRHTALVLACDNHDDVEELELLAQELGRAAGATQPLLVRPGGRRVWAWIATRDVPDLAVLTTAFDASDRGSIRVAVGSSPSGVDGFIASHTEAERTLSVIPADETARIERYSEVELVVLLGCSQEVDTFVVRTLGDLIRDDEHTQRLRETVAAYLDNGGNVDDASRRLTVHRNTIRYRIGQAEEILGHSISKVSPEITVALRHHLAYHSDGSLNADN